MLSCGPKFFSIFQGDTKPLFLKILAQDCGNLDPYDLTNVTEVDVAIPRTDGTMEHFLFTEGDVAIESPEILGKVSVAIDAERSMEFNVGELQNFTVTLTVAGAKITVPYPAALSVFQAV